MSGVKNYKLLKEEMLDVLDGLDILLFTNMMSKVKVGPFKHGVKILGCSDTVSQALALVLVALIEREQSDSGSSSLRALCLEERGRIKNELVKLMLEERNAGGESDVSSRREDRDRSEVG